MEKDAIVDERDYVGTLEYVEGLKKTIASLTETVIRHEDTIEGYKRRVAKLVDEICALEKVRDTLFTNR